MSLPSLNMPRDNFGEPVPVLRPRADGAKQGTAGVTSSVIGPFSAGVRVISIWAASDIRYQTGAVGVVAAITSHKLAAGERHTISLGGAGDVHTHIAIIRDATGASDVTVEVSEME